VDADLDNLVTALHRRFDDLLVPTPSGRRGDRGSASRQRWPMPSC
jgi:hypothetical protein